MPKVISTEEFLNLSKTIPIIDVRSPGEYDHAHIPGALSLPLFSNEERAEVGTIYKQRGRVKAVQRGLEIVGPKMSQFSKSALALNSQQVLVHCWRGGMRSSSMAWLLETLGLECYLLEGGYKSYRNHVLTSFEKKLKIVLLGGFTGSGKTDLLTILKDSGEQVIDLEGLANHKGSAFGSIGLPPQPSSEMFENMLSEEIIATNPHNIVWIEDESRNVGKVFVPEMLWLQMRSAPLIKIDTPFDTRVERLIRDYATDDTKPLEMSIAKIEKRLGYDNCKFALEACRAGDLKKAAEICLIYYDKAYASQLNNRFGADWEKLPSLTYTGDNSNNVSRELKSLAETFAKNI
jgi:tRNA 2-selenouridine synthase